MERTQKSRPPEIIKLNDAAKLVISLCFFSHFIMVLNLFSFPFFFFAVGLCTIHVSARIVMHIDLHLPQCGLLNMLLGFC